MDYETKKFAVVQLAGELGREDTHISMKCLLAAHREYKRGSLQEGLNPSN